MSSVGKTCSGSSFAAFDMERAYSKRLTPFRCGFETTNVVPLLVIDKTTGIIALQPDAKTIFFIACSSANTVAIMPISNRFCVPYISPGVSFVCSDKKHLERLDKHLDLLGPLIARSQPMGYEHWRIFVQYHTDDIPATFTLAEAPAKSAQRGLLSAWTIAFSNR